ncbi:hypothetical protein BT63DRAFT_227240 [Microthyrium microscopicum]|uniref:Rhodopsin domain-containing protein n=1 Tax=Microthyrium microscopicum TaxID=703497 RepID=A0A6A6UEW6_9PEZI|nr:hypothetical protein BT63DRAFT_227240 [Microthyrium microscopicum]
MPHQTFDTAALQHTSIVFIILTWIAVCARCYTRLRIKQFTLDDGVMIATLGLFTCYCAVLVAIYDIAGHAWALQMVETLSDMKRVVHLIRVSECLYIMTMIFLKLALALFFLKLVVEAWQRAIIYTVLVTYIGFSMAYFFFVIFQCRATNIIKVLVLMMAGKCSNGKAALFMNYTHAILNSVTDWICSLVPIIFINKSTLPLRVKWASVGLISLAAIGSVASLVRIFYVKSVMHPQEDFFINTKYLAIWSTIEPGVGIVVASLATLRPLFARCFATTVTAMRKLSVVGGTLLLSEKEKEKMGDTIQHTTTSKTDHVVTTTVTEEIEHPERAKMAREEQRDSEESADIDIDIDSPYVSGGLMRFPTTSAVSDV